VTQVKIMMDSYTGKPRGFGFVEMASVEDGAKAIAALNGILLDERALNVDEARPRKQPGGFRDQHADAPRWRKTLVVHRSIPCASVEDGNKAITALNGTQLCGHTSEHQ
jgi:RNA recognition motif-containing protein